MPASMTGCSISSIWVSRVRIGCLPAGRPVLAGRGPGAPPAVAEPHSLGPMGDLRLSYRRALARVRLVTRTVTELGLPTVGLVAANSARRQVAAWRGAAGRACHGRRADAGSAAPGGARRHRRPLGLRARRARGPLPGRRRRAPVVGSRPDAGPLRRGRRGGLARARGGHQRPGRRRTRPAQCRAGRDRRRGGVGPHVATRRDRSAQRGAPGPARGRMGTASRHAARRALQRARRAVGRCRSARRAVHVLWNTDAGGSWSSGQGPLYLGIPVVVATHPDGDTLTFYENSTRGVFSFGEPGQPGVPAERRAVGGTASVGFAGGVLRHYVMVGDVPHLLDRYTELTGRPALPPRWALGYHQSRWGYKTEADVREVVDGYRALGLPLSAVHLDIDYMDGYRVFTFDRSRFPDPGGAGVGAGGVGGSPGDDRRPRGEGGRRLRRLPPGSRRRTVLCRRDGTAGRGCGLARTGGVPRFHRPLEHGGGGPGTTVVLTDAGIAGIWHDMNEPASISLLGDPSLPLSTRHDFDGRGGDHGEGHNLYGLLMNRAGHEGLSVARPATTTVHRVAFGVGRYAALGVELDRRRGQHVGVDAPADGDGDRPGVVGGALFGSGHRRVQRRARRRALHPVAADERPASLLPDPLGPGGAGT